MDAQSFPSEQRGRGVAVVPCLASDVEEMVDGLRELLRDMADRIVAQEALLAERPAAPDPALLALAKMGAMVLGWFECGFPAIPGGVVDDMAVRSGCALEVSDGGGHACWTAPNIRLAIATLLAPDGADGAGEAATDA